MARRLYRVGERLQDVLRFRNVPYDALLLLLDAAARLRVIDSSRRCSDSSNRAANRRSIRCAETTPFPRRSSLTLRACWSSIPVVWRSTGETLAITGTE
jgi:hypothetical protein